MRIKNKVAVIRSETDELPKVCESIKGNGPPPNDIHLYRIQFDSW